MKIAYIALTSLLVFTSVHAGLRENTNISEPDLNKLKLNLESFLTDKNGIINVKAISILQVGDRICMYRTDGTLYTGQITETREEDGSLHVYGNVHNSDDTHFGFVLAKGGIFAGAIVDKKNSKTYAIEFSDAHKGFIFLLTNKYDKPSA